MDDRAVLNRLTVIEQRTKNLRPWFDKVADAVAVAQMINFTGHGSLVGGWKPLSPQYAEWKHSHYPGPIMVISGKLMESLTKRPFAIERMTGRTLEIGSDVSYAHFHQKGTKNMPRRRILVIPESLLKSMKRDLADYVVNGRLKS